VNPVQITIALQERCNFWSRSYQTFFLRKQSNSPFFATRLCHFIVNIYFFHLLQTLKLNSPNKKTKKNKACQYRVLILKQFSNVRVNFLKPSSFKIVNDVGMTSCFNRWHFAVVAAGFVVILLLRKYK